VDRNPRSQQGVKLVKTQYPYRRTRSLARTAGQIDKARELRQTPTETERAAWHLLRGLRSRGFKFHLVIPFVLIFVLRGKWKFVAGFTSVVALLAALSLAIVGTQGMVSYVRLIALMMRHPENSIYASIVPANMPNVRGFFTALMEGTIGLKSINIVVALVSVSSFCSRPFYGAEWRNGIGMTHSVQSLPPESRFR
jgi:hypothetical protein